MSFKVNSEWKYKIQNKKYISTNFPSCILNYNYDNNIEYTYSKIIFYLENAVKKRVIGTTDRPIACLLSGGLDSSIIASIICKIIRKIYISSNSWIKKTFISKTTIISKITFNNTTCICPIII